MLCRVYITNDTSCQSFKTSLSDNVLILYEPAHDKTNKMVFASSEDSDQA